MNNNNNNNNNDNNNNNNDDHNVTMETHFCLWIYILLIKAHNVIPAKIHTGIVIKHNTKA